MGTGVTMGPSDNPGRASRALPLFLAEHIAHHSPVRTTTLIPWVMNGHGGFILSGKASDDADVVEHARRTTEGADRPADYALNSHLIVRGENYTIRLRLIRCIDARCLAEITRDFPENGFFHVADSLLAELGKHMDAEDIATLDSLSAGLGGAELDHYLFRLEQALAVSCSAMEDRFADSLSNPAEILDGMLHLCLQNPKHLPSRMLLLRSMAKLQKNQSALVASMKPKVEALMADHPVDRELQGILEKELKEVLVA